MKALLKFVKDHDVATCIVLGICGVLILVATVIFVSTR